MRSRYSAFASANIDYLLATLHPSQHQADERQALAQSIASSEWLSLTVLATEAGQAGDLEGVVEFAARYQQTGEQGVLHERSRFVFEHGRWFYVDGEFEPVPANKPGRNDPCWCGSGKKFKKCHG
jgi:SEC-C motif-containing protein